MEVYALVQRSELWLPGGVQRDLHQQLPEHNQVAGPDHQELESEQPLREPGLAAGVFYFTNWNGIETITADNFVSLKHYVFLFTCYIFFRPAVLHNVLWLGFLTLVATPLGILFAVLLDCEVRGTRVYQSILYL